MRIPRIVFLNTGACAGGLTVLRSLVLVIAYTGVPEVHIAAVGWIYVTLMMAITEETVVAGIMTFFFYGVLPTLIILYLAGSGQRRKRRDLARQQEMQKRQQAADAKDTPGGGPVS